MPNNGPADAPSTNPESQLVRALSLPTLAANIANTTIGAGIFVLPALVARDLGAAAPLAYMACSGAMALFVTCFAIGGSRVPLSGGLYAFVEVAFGPYLGFIAALLLITTGVSAAAGIINVFGSTVASLVPQVSGPGGRAGVALVVLGTLAWINIRGVRLGGVVVSGFTVGKLVPLLAFIVVGLFFVNPPALALKEWPAPTDLSRPVLLLIFAFFGIETALSPSGEVARPERNIPRAIYLSLVITTSVYLLVQLVAQGTLGHALAAQRDSPLAAAAATIFGSTGRAVFLAAATVSILGYVTSNVLSVPRVIFGLSRDRLLPSWFGHVHPRFHSPDAAIISYCGCAFVLSFTAGFEALAVVSNVAALLLYLMACAAAWELRRRDVRTDEVPFDFPGAGFLPLLAGAVVIWILSGARAPELLGTGIVLVVGTLLYWGRKLLALRQLSDH